MRLFAAALALAFAGCDAFSEPDLFGSPEYDVYLATLAASDVPDLTARIGLQFFGNDAVVEGQEDCIREGGFYGVWAVGSEATDAEGAVVGGVGCGGEAVLVDLLDANAYDAPVRYRIEGTIVDGQIEGTWTRGERVGTVSGRLVRAATQPVAVP